MNEDLATLAFENGINFFDISEPFTSKRAEVERGRIIKKTLMDMLNLHDGRGPHEAIGNGEATIIHHINGIYLNVINVSMVSLETYSAQQTKQQQEMLK